jgi:hypothetical protein
MYLQQQSALAKAYWMLVPQSLAGLKRVSVSMSWIEVAAVVERGYESLAMVGRMVWRWSCGFVLEMVRSLQ